MPTHAKTQPYTQFSKPWTSRFEHPFLVVPRDNHKGVFRRPSFFSLQVTRALMWLAVSQSYLLAVSQCRILGHSSNPVCGFYVIKQFRLSFALGELAWASLNQILGWTTVRECYSRALEQGPLL